MNLSIKKNIPHLNELAELLFGYAVRRTEVQFFSVPEEFKQILVGVRELHYGKANFGSLK